MKECINEIDERRIGMARIEEKDERVHANPPPPKKPKTEMCESIHLTIFMFGV